MSEGLVDAGRLAQALAGVADIETESAELEYAGVEAWLRRWASSGTAPVWQTRN